MVRSKDILLIAALSAVIRTVSSVVSCYSCVSTQPGCADEFDWRLHKAINCDTTCVKIIETKGATRVITRDCLSNIQAVRTDIPADTFEGCRDAAVNPKYAVDVGNAIKEYDLKRDYYTQTQFCFCKLDNWCNNVPSVKSSAILIIIVSLTGFICQHLSLFAL